MGNSSYGLSQVLTYVEIFIQHRSRIISKLSLIKSPEKLNITDFYDRQVLYILVKRRLVNGFKLISYNAQRCNYWS